MFLLAISALPAVSAAEGVQEKAKMKAVEDGLASALGNHVNSDLGLNHPTCARKPNGEVKCTELPKAQWVTVTATVDWASFKGKLDDSHGYDAVQDKCTALVMGLNWIGDNGTYEERAAYNKAAREQIKSVTCRLDPKAKDKPLLAIKGGVFSGGFGWDTDFSRTDIGTWLQSKL